MPMPCRHTHCYHRHHPHGGAHALCYPRAVRILPTPLSLPITSPLAPATPCAHADVTTVNLAGQPPYLYHACPCRSHYPLPPSPCDRRSRGTT
ncbi:hypothetical protein E2562_017707 [Oryza meyeriana var. granulata]|uniref:Uncharacterized protein n=1 Tax=Oryza meyeriana var. granulata TaxID=110450 RepID=A0A6G1BYK8_9ORYZ|nr:hypothetical protein E2562_017707 [Oryza meyeriana var. granulata]